MVAETTPVMVTTALTDRSIPPLRITTVWPMDTRPRKAGEIEDQQEVVEARKAAGDDCTRDRSE